MHVDLAMLPERVTDVHSRYTVLPLLSIKFAEVHLEEGDVLKRY